MIAKIENGGSRRRVYRHAHRPRPSRAPGYLAVAILAVLAILAVRPTYWDWQDGTYAVCLGHTVIIGIGDGGDHALCDY